MSSPSGRRVNVPSRIGVSEMTRDPRVTKRRVTMRSESVLPNGAVVVMSAVDYVRPDFLDAYVKDAKTRWQTVDVSDTPDAGPGGYAGATHIPAHLPVKNAGVTYSQKD